MGRSKKRKKTKNREPASQDRPVKSEPRASVAGGSRAKDTGPQSEPRHVAAKGGEPAPETPSAPETPLPSSPADLDRFAGDIVPLWETPVTAAAATEDTSPSPKDPDRGKPVGTVKARAQAKTTARSKHVDETKAKTKTKPVAGHDSMSPVSDPKSGSRTRSPWPAIGAGLGVAALLALLLGRSPDDEAAPLSGPTAASVSTPRAEPNAAVEPAAAEPAVQPEALPVEPDPVPLADDAASEQASAPADGPEPSTPAAARAALDVNPEVHRAYALLEAGKLDEAERFFLSLVARVPGHREVQFGLSEVARRRAEAAKSATERPEPSPRAPSVVAAPVMAPPPAAAAPRPPPATPAPVEAAPTPPPAAAPPPTPPPAEAPKVPNVAAFPPLE